MNDSIFAMKIAGLWLVLFCCALTGLTAPMTASGLQEQSGRHAQRMYEVGHRVYGLIESAFRDAGMVLPEAAYPANGAQLLYYVRLLDSASLSATGEAYADQARRILGGWDGPGPVLAELADDFSLEFEPLINLELRLDDERPDKRVLDAPLDVLTLNSRVAMGPLWGEMQFMLRQEPNHGRLSGESWSNVPGAVEWIDFNLPRRGYMSVGGERWSAQVGRDALAWGSSRSGSLTYSGEADYLDFARLSTFYRWFSYSGVFLRLEPWVHVDADPAEVPDGGRYAPPEGDYRSWRKSIVTHRFTFRPHERLRFSLMESAGVGGYAPDLRLFNPFMILHNHFDFTLMTFATSAELTVVPLRGLELYGQWYMNDIMLPQEAEAGAVEPNAMAWLGGFQYQLPLDTSLARFGAEVFYSDPYVYIRESVLRSFTYRHRVHTNYDGSGGESLGNIEWHDGFLGSPFGNDSLALVLFGGIELLNTAGLELEFVRHHDGEKGASDILIPGAAAVEESTPTGTPQYVTQVTGVLSVSSAGFPQLVLPESMVLDTALTGRMQWIENVAHGKGDTAFRGAASLSLGASWKFPY